MTTFESDLPALEARKLRRLYLAANVFEGLIGVMGVLAALAFFLDPHALERSPIGQAIHPFDVFWNLLYLAGGVGIIVGLALPSARVELASLFLFGAAVLGNAAAVLMIRGVSGAASISIYAAVVGAFVVRGWLIVRATRARSGAVDRLGMGE